VRESPIPGPVPRFELATWREQYGVVAGITGRGAETAPFDLGLAGVTAPVGQVMDRWRELRTSIPEFSGLIVSRQVHGTEILWHDQGRGLVIYEGADGHATATPGLLLAVTAADCIPVYVVDPVRRAIALLHAGWRGVAGGILGLGIGLLVRHGSRVEDLLVHCGVGICGTCYEVGSEVLARCGRPRPVGGHGRLDLRSVLAEQAGNLGVAHISTSQFCSRHDSGSFFSHRGSGGQDGRMVAYLGLLP
jgi:polyphenol oxidase